MVSKLVFFGVVTVDTPTAIIRKTTTRTSGNDLHKNTKLLNKNNGKDVLPFFDSLVITSLLIGKLQLCHMKYFRNRSSTTEVCRHIDMLILVLGRLLNRPSLSCSHTKKVTGLSIFGPKVSCVNLAKQSCPSL